MKIKKNKNLGMALVEILIGATIITVGILAIVTSYTVYLQYALANQKNVEASYLLEENIEVITFFRNESWTENIATLSTTTDYYFVFQDSSWATTTIPQYVDGHFLRSFTITDVNRDANDDIADIGTYDPDIKKITATVEYWQGHSTTTKSISTYITNLYNN